MDCYCFFNELTCTSATWYYYFTNTHGANACFIHQSFSTIPKSVNEKKKRSATFNCQSQANDQSSKWSCWYWIGLTHTPRKILGANIRLHIVRIRRITRCKSVCMCEKWIHQTMTATRRTSNQQNTIPKTIKTTFRFSLRTFFFLLRSSLKTRNVFSNIFFWRNIWDTWNKCCEIILKKSVQV